ncbi:MAG: DNA topoisomerase IV subunit B [Gammaproteobacteria bacterium]|nr:DNA topoisomerase IV subunit B [Gammaproteobacteria bacterium]MBT8124055.1 DNA topoisomerase IV subunit B [Gammaproteobacteria bacterium]NNC69027.1 DNA topoisomerase IV subunit B [Gammaproteobacteria bacterium]
MAGKYNASDIEVLSGLDPVRKRPGMYTDTTRPNHLAHEVIDNSVDEAISGYAKSIDIKLYKDGSLEVADDGRGMPVDKHPKLKLPGVEVILSTLHSGGKFSNKNYSFSGGLHGVGVSVVNALSKNLEIWVRRGGKEYNMAFKGGVKSSKLEVVGSVGQRNTGTTIRFWPDTKYFESDKFSVSKLLHTMRAKAILCPGLQISFDDQVNKKKYEWCFEDGLKDYLLESIEGIEHIPQDSFCERFEGEEEAVEWAITWLLEEGEGLKESYVNLVPTAQGGTHVSGLRTGLTEALREFCEFRKLLPRGVKLTPEDVWERLCYVLSVKIKEPQFAGQTKERLSSRETAVFVAGVAKDSFGHWLNQNAESGEQIAQLAISNAESRLRKSKKVVRKKIASGPALPGKLADCTSEDLSRTELFLVEGDSAGGSAKQARDRVYQAIMPLRGKILNTWEVSSDQVLASQEVHDISVAIGIEPGSSDLSGLRYGKVCVLADADSDGLHIATLLCALFLQHFQTLVEAGHVYMAMPPLYRIDVGKEVFYALDDEEQRGVLDRIKAENKTGKVTTTRFKGLGEMDPMQLRESTMAIDTRRLVQLTLTDEKKTFILIDMLLAKKRAADRKVWLEKNGNLVRI